MSRIRVLIVDDSATMRGILTATLSRDPDIEVIGGAQDAFEAREMIKHLNPDVITLDVEMPGMNGIEFLEKIMRLRPMPVIMVSTLTQAGATTTIEAMALGAVDAVGKPHFSDLTEKVKCAAGARLRSLGERPRAVEARTDYTPGNKLLAIGSSTGGVEALLEVISSFPENCPPTVITQHMPPGFTASFAARLDRMCKPKVSEATDGAILQVGQIYLAPGGERHMEVVGGTVPRVRLTEGPTVSGHRPSVDALFRSVAKAYDRRAVGVILTGMGRDGAEGLLDIRKAGGRTIGQDESSCVVYGMPKAAFEIGAVEKQARLSQIANAALDLCAVPARGAA